MANSEFSNEYIDRAFRELRIAFLCDNYRPAELHEPFNERPYSMVDKRFDELLDDSLDDFIGNDSSEQILFATRRNAAGVLSEVPAYEKNAQEACDDALSDMMAKALIEQSHPVSRNNQFLPAVQLTNDLQAFGMVENSINLATAAAHKKIMERRD